MNTRLIFLLTGLFLLITAGQVTAQSFEERRAEIQREQEQTESEIRSLEGQIERYHQRIEETGEEYESLYRQYEEVTRLITLQDERIQRMEQEQEQIARELDLVQENLNELSEQLDELIRRYRNTLTYLYKHGRTTELALILTSTSINQLLVRSTYLSRFHTYREQQEAELREQQRQYEQAREDLRQTRQRNEESLASIEREKEELARQEADQEERIMELQQNREELEAQLAEVQQQREELDRALTDLIAEEEEIIRAEEERQRRLAEAETIEDDDEREEAVTRYSQPMERAAAVSEEELAIYEEGFRDSRGQLPWPVEGGTVTENFGERVHPVFGTRTNNPGIDIATTARSQVEVIHDGYVFAVQPFTGFGDVVMVHHGQYKTIYGNLSDVFVTRGHVLSQGDVIGLSGDENSIRGEVLFFMIRDGNDNVNPENWLQSPVP